MPDLLHLAVLALSVLIVQGPGAATAALAAAPKAATTKQAAVAAESWEGYWAKSRRDCRASDGPDSKTFIDLKNAENGKPAPLYDQYENHCRIDSHATQGNVTTLKLTCYEFWDDYKARKNPRSDTVTVTPKDRNTIVMNGSSNIRCRK